MCASRGGYRPIGATTRAQNAAVQVSSIRPALPQHSCRRPQHIQSSTTPYLPIDAEILSSRSDGAVARCRRRGINLICPCPLSALDSYRDKAPAAYKALSTPKSHTSAASFCIWARYDASASPNCAINRRTKSLKSHSDRNLLLTMHDHLSGTRGGGFKHGQHKGGCGFGPSLCDR